MRKGLIVLLAVVMVGVFALPAMADVSFFGSARVVPTYYRNFDFDKNKPDVSTLNEGGFASGEHIRSELRLGWKAGGDKWKINMIAESDMIWNNSNADRSFYSTSDINPSTGSAFQLGGVNSIPNAGAEFGLERVELSYAFLPALELFAGWPISSVDIGTGGLLYGDDHPIIGFRGKIADNIKYQLAYLSIMNTPQIAVSESTIARDWRVYFLKPEFTIGTGAMKGTLSPILLFSDFRGAPSGTGGANVISATAKTYYYGLEGIGQFGMIKPSFEVIIADGEFRPIGTTPKRDIKSRAAFAGVELALMKAFNPYIALRYTEGDGNSSDTKVNGFVGVTDIGRFTPLMGMDGNILGEHLASGASLYNSPLYSYSPDRAVGGNLYGGIGRSSSGNNPGERIVAVGAKGTMNEFSYKAQAFLIRYDNTGNLVKGAGKPAGAVGKTAGYTFDLQGIYAFSPNFSVNGIYSMFAPGNGIKDQLPSTAASTIASLYTMNLVWTY